MPRVCCSHCGPNGILVNTPPALHTVAHAQGSAVNKPVQTKIPTHTRLLPNTPLLSTHFYGHHNNSKYSGHASTSSALQERKTSERLQLISGRRPTRQAPSRRRPYASQVEGRYGAQNAQSGGTPSPRAGSANPLEDCPLILAMRTTFHTSVARTRAQRIKQQVSRRPWHAPAKAAPLRSKTS